MCIQLFRDRQQEFHRAVTLFNAWYACLIKIRNETEKSTGVNLSNKFPKQFISFSLHSIAANYKLDDIKRTFPHALDVSPVDLKNKVKEFGNCEAQKTFRGKYELEFVLKFIELLINDSLKAQQHLKRKIQFSFNSKLNNEQAVKVFSSYAETPDSLKKYLMQIT